MKDIKVAADISYIGVDDKDLDLFENQYKVPNGISYNSYLIRDEKIVIMDTIDNRKTKEWLENLENALKGDKPDYLVISHLEPDHSANIKLLSDKYSEMKLVGNSKTFDMLSQFFDINNIEDRKVVVKEADTLNIGKHMLQFFMAPMVHWPEVMVTYEQIEKILFSADAFGTFGILDIDEPWENEARRYYFNIVGKYGMQVQALLKKLSSIEVKTICSLHGPILKANLEYYIEKYNIWSSYEPEEKGILIPCASIYGNTLKVVNKLAEILIKKGAKKVIVADLTREDMSVVLENAFRYDTIVFAASTYNMGIFPYMETFLNNLKGKNYQNRKYAIIENGSWAPAAGKKMEEIIYEMKNLEKVSENITIKTTMTEENLEQLNKLADNLLK